MTLDDDHSLHMPVLFSSRALAREWIEDHYGYIKQRRDLRAEPHRWRMPQPVRVTVRLERVRPACRP
jgi:hypothetical protein